MTTLFDAVILIIASTLFAGLWMLPLGIVSIPACLMRRTTLFSLIVLIMAQTYLYLGFVCWLNSAARYAIANRGAVGIVIWPVTFCLTILPAKFAFTELYANSPEEQPVVDLNRYTLPYCWGVSAVGFFVFALGPSWLRNPWHWMWITNF